MITMIFTRYTEAAGFIFDSLRVEKRKSGFFGKDKEIVLIVNGIDFVVPDFTDAHELLETFLVKKEVISCVKHFEGNAADEFAETVNYTIVWEGNIIFIRRV